MSRTLNGAQIQLALAQHFNWFQNRMMPEWEIDGGRADLLFVSRAGYATEIEIKVSFSDWQAYRDKEKWKRGRPHIARFFYAVPASLALRLPDWLPEGAGILAIDGLRVRIVREARRFVAQKLAPAEIRRMEEACYYRFWRAELRKRRAT